ncbi:MAG: GNAT family N-acetyltransferase [Myxococcales bacterium]|nr:GNAT family N-acetyltransferase [Myxococcales bacterium]
MTLTWIAEQGPTWDADKARIVGGAAAGIFDTRFERLKAGDPVPGQWWHVQDGDETVGYGWLDVVWGDAEITLATAPEAEAKGVGSFTLAELEKEARKQGINYLYNIVRPNHPKREEVTAWLKKRGFVASEDGSLFRVATRAKG